MSRQGPDTIQRSSPGAGRPTARFHELDSMRGLASLTVFFSHFVMLNRLSGPVYTHLRMSPLHLFWDGESAVLFFFVLSGFVLALPYVQDRNKPLELLGFYFKRILRIYPAFLFTILLALALKHYLYHPGSMQHYSDWFSGIWNWTVSEQKTHVLNTFTLFINDYNTNLIDPVIWSLLVEMKLSFLVPFFIMIINRGSFMFNALFIIVLLYLGADFYIGTFYFGILLARYHHIPGEYIRKAPLYVVVILFVAAILLYSCRYSFDMGNTPADEKNQLRLYLSTAGSCLFIVLALSVARFSQMLRNGFCLFLGRISYSFYLVHLPVLITVASLFPYTTNYSLIPLLAVSLPIAWLVSYLMYRTVETPFQDLAHRLSRKIGFFGKIKFRSEEITT